MRVGMFMHQTKVPHKYCDYVLDSLAKYCPSVISLKYPAVHWQHAHAWPASEIVPVAITVLPNTSDTEQHAVPHHDIFFAMFGGNPPPDLALEFMVQEPEHLRMVGHGDEPQAHPYGSTIPSSTGS
jgi:hypothetical protein